MKIEFELGGRQVIQTGMLSNIEKYENNRKIYICYCIIFYMLILHCVSKNFTPLLLALLLILF